MKFYRLASGFPTKSGSLLPTKRGRELPTLTPILDAHILSLQEKIQVLEQEIDEMEYGFDYINSIKVPQTVIENNYILKNERHGH